jgi:hypothetical protein
VASDCRAGPRSGGATVVVEIARAFVLRPSLHALRVRRIVLLVDMDAALNKELKCRRVSELS